MRINRRKSVDSTQLLGKASKKGSLDEEDEELLVNGSSTPSSSAGVSGLRRGLMKMASARAVTATSSSSSAAFSSNEGIDFMADFDMAPAPPTTATNEDEAANPAPKQLDPADITNSEDEREEEEKDLAYTKIEIKEQPEQPKKAKKPRRKSTGLLAVPDEKEETANSNNKHKQAEETTTKPRRKTKVPKRRSIKMDLSLDDVPESPNKSVASAMTSTTTKSRQHRPTRSMMRTASARVLTDSNPRDESTSTEKVNPRRSRPARASMLRTASARVLTVSSDHTSSSSKKDEGSEPEKETTVASSTDRRRSMMQQQSFRRTQSRRKLMMRNPSDRRLRGNSSGKASSESLWPTEKSLSKNHSIGNSSNGALQRMDEDKDADSSNNNNKDSSSSSNLHFSTSSGMDYAMANSSKPSDARKTTTALDNRLLRRSSLQF